MEAHRRTKRDENEWSDSNNHTNKWKQTTKSRNQTETIQLRNSMLREQSSHWLLIYHVGMTLTKTRAEKHKRVHGYHTRSEAAACSREKYKTSLHGASAKTVEINKDHLSKTK